MKKSNLCVFTIATVALLFINSALINAQVAIGSIKEPEKFSLLELISGEDKGLRLPQMTTEQREAMSDVAFKLSPLSQGLQIFNMDTKFVETWNGSKWIVMSETVAFPDKASAGSVEVQDIMISEIVESNYDDVEDVKTEPCE